LLVSVVVVNLVTIAADLQAGAAGIGLLAGVGSRWLVVPLGAAVAGLLLVGKYAQVVGVLRYLMLGFLAFGAAAVLAHPDWPRLLQASLVPALSLRRNEMAGGLALLGTTLTSYVYVWETGRGVEQPSGALPSPAASQARRRHRRRVHRRDLVVNARRRCGHARPASPRGRLRAGRRPGAPPAGRAAAADLFAAGLVTSALVALPVVMAGRAAGRRHRS
jgi:hypothetical protein